MYFISSLRREAHTRLRLLMCSLVLMSSCALAQSPQPVLLPAALAYDANGNLFIADAARSQVLELTVGGDVLVVAGTGAQGFGGDGAAASAALLNEPRGVAVRADGTLYIADTGNRRIRSVSKGVIATVAGKGSGGNSGDGGPASAATFAKPAAIAVEGDALLVCDVTNHRVRRIADGIIQVFAGDGTQGFGGDGGTASAAQLDSPQGLAMLADGRVLISDAHNNRIRAVGTDGLMRTFAGSGVAGYSGDGGSAIAAKLSHPQALSVLPNGAVLVADADNQRVRLIDAAGVISTVAGSGTQGASADADAAVESSMNLPRGLAVSPYGNVTVADSSAPSLRAVALNGSLYLLPAPISRTSKVALVLSPTSVYGQTSASVAVTAVNAQGRVEVDEGSTVLASGSLTNGALSVSLPKLAAVSHVLIAKYSGDGLNASATSEPLELVVNPALVTATAEDFTIAYGQSLSPLTGTLTGVLPQDAGDVRATFSVTATPASDAGSYPILATLSGPASGNYSLTNAASAGTLTIRQAKTTTSASTLSQTSYAGLPLALRASVAPEFGGDPAGEVDFLEGGVIIARTRTASGSAGASYLSPSSGTHVITAAYLGSNNFEASSSGPVSVAVSALPDFTVQTANSSQSVQAGLMATFALTVSPQGGPFTGSVTFSVSGLPSGAQATFSPAAVVPGAGGAATTLNIQTPARHASRRDLPVGMKWFALLPIVLVLHRRKRRVVLCIAVLAGVMFGSTGCGDRTVGSSTSTNSQQYAVMVTATSTNLAGAVVTHNIPLSLTVQ